MPRRPESDRLAAALAAGLAADARERDRRAALVAESAAAAREHANRPATRRRPADAHIAGVASPAEQARAVAKARAAAAESVRPEDFPVGERADTRAHGDPRCAILADGPGGPVQRSRQRCERNLSAARMRAEVVTASDPRTPDYRGQRGTGRVPYVGCESAPAGERGPGKRNGNGARDGSITAPGCHPENANPQPIGEWPEAKRAKHLARTNAPLRNAPHGTANRGAKPSGGRANPAATTDTRPRAQTRENGLKPAKPVTPWAKTSDACRNRGRKTENESEAHRAARIAALADPELAARREAIRASLPF